MFFAKKTYSSSEAVVKRYHLKKDALKNFAKLTGNHLLSESLFNEVVGQTFNFYKKDTPTQVFPCEFCDIFKNTFFIERFWWLLLHHKGQCSKYTSEKKF